MGGRFGGCNEYHRSPLFSASLSEDAYSAFLGRWDWGSGKCCLEKVNNALRVLTRCSNFSLRYLARVARMPTQPTQHIRIMGNDEDLQVVKVDSSSMNDE